MFYGHYKSSVVGTSGCVKEFVSTPTALMGFPPHVSFYCDLCKDTHSFRFTQAHQVSTPSVSRSFDEFCEVRHIERDVEVPGVHVAT